MAGIRQALHEKFGNTALLVLNSQRKNYPTKMFIGSTG
tara:strand:+ start:450 stop:563 length:114 start_codon:yes stop_codon:yes gene_type:complete